MTDTNLKEEIKRLGMTQKEFAENIGVAENTVGQWVRGVIKTPKWAIRMIELLHKEKAYESAKGFFCDQNR
jgi:transcriptional regulator with XRE-family HTH domain